MDQAMNKETQLAEPAPQEVALAQSGSNVLRRHIKENPRKAVFAACSFVISAVSF